MDTKRVVRIGLTGALVGAAAARLLAPNARARSRSPVTDAELRAGPRPGSTIEQLVTDGIVVVGRHSYGLSDIELWRSPGDVLPLLRIGAFCSIASQVRFIVNGDHHTEWITTFPLTYFGPDGDPFMPDPEGRWHPRPTGGITIGNDVWIGTRATVLGGVTIGDGAVVAAGSLVASDVAPYEIVGGVPARVIRKRFESDTAERVRALRWWDWPDDLIRSSAELLLTPPDAATLAALEAAAPSPSSG